MDTMSQQEIVKWLEQQGYRFSDLTLSSEGEYAVEDSDWNYKDSQHLDHVHALAKQLQFVISGPMKCAVHLQSIFGLWFPMLNVSYEFEKYRQVYIFAFLSFIMVVETRSEALEPLKTRVTTRYSIGCPRYLFFLAPILKGMLAKNYRTLMEDDVPMRERRGALRKLGYIFPMKGETYGFTDSLNNMENRIDPPPHADRRVTCRYRELLAAKNEQLVGDIGLLGFRLVRDGHDVTIFPRACPHEGASLDGRSCASGVLVCPWHGRRVRPIAKFTWGQDADVVSGNYHVRVTGDEIIIDRKE